MPHGLNPTYKGRGKHAATAEAISTLNRKLNGFVGFDGIYIEVAGDETRFFFRGEGGGASSAKHPFGVLSLNAQTGVVKVSGGFIIHGTKRVSVAASEVTIAGGTLDAPTEGGIQYDYAAGTSAWLPMTVAVGELTPTHEVWMQPMFSAYRKNGKAVIKEILWDSIVILPGVFAPGV